MGSYRVYATKQAAWSPSGKTTDASSIVSAGCCDLVYGGFNEFQYWYAVRAPIALNPNDLIAQNRPRDIVRTSSVQSIQH
ncbi:hypothetical protein ACVIIV_003426 [Bradyrhizobium sp. USDA 4354]